MNCIVIIVISHALLNIFPHLDLKQIWMDQQTGSHPSRSGQPVQVGGRNSGGKWSPAAAKTGK